LVCILGKTKSTIVWGKSTIGGISRLCLIISRLIGL